MARTQSVSNVACRNRRRMIAKEVSSISKVHTPRAGKGIHKPSSNELPPLTHELSIEPLGSLPVLYPVQNRRDHFSHGRHWHIGGKPVISPWHHEQPHERLDLPGATHPARDPLIVRDRVLWRHDLIRPAMDDQ